MTKQERINFLEYLKKESPEDPFAHYAYILEVAENQTDAGLTLWLELENTFPEYLPLYYQSGQSALKNADPELAVAQWKKGLELALIQKNQHAAAELKSAIMNCLVDDDE